MADKVGWTSLPRAVKPAAAGRSRASALRGLEAGGWLAQLLRELGTSSPCKNSFLTPFFSSVPTELLPRSAEARLRPGRSGLDPCGGEELRIMLEPSASSGTLLLVVRSTPAAGSSSFRAFASSLGNPAEGPFRPPSGWPGGAQRRWPCGGRHARFRASREGRS